MCAQILSPRVWFCFILLLAFTALSANAQTDITATTNSTTIQYLGIPNPQGTTDNAVTAPLGGIILKGTAISPVTGQPFRHLWVDDATSGICRVDPDLDSPGPYAMNLNTCPFKINGASVTGGPLAFDPVRNFLYFADEQRASQGVIRMGFIPSGDNGHGFLDFGSVFIMGGNTTGARFGGGDTGCPLIASVPSTGLLPHAVALSPQGDLYVGFKKNAAIVRFNSPGTASSDGFGTCTQFIQQVATVSKITQGLAWIGHDLWGSDGTSPFVVKNADTTCLVPPHGQCTTASGDVLNVLGAAPVGAAPTGVMSDQYYPALNGNNVYFTLAPAGGPDNLAWLGNASAVTNPGGVPASSTLDTALFGTFSPAAGPAFTIANLNGLAVDPTDPANLVVFSGDDYSGAGLLAKGMWFESCQGVPPNPQPGVGVPWVNNCPTPAATAVPGVPQNVFGVAANNQITLNWSPVQSNQPITSYTVQNNSSTGAVIPTFTVNPAAGSAFPATSTVIPAVNGTTYTFQVAATNAVGTSAFSAPSAPITPPGTQVPNAPTACPAPPCATPGDTQAFVTWTVSVPNGTPVLSYTVTAYLGIGGPAAGITVTVPAPASGNTGSAVIGGLTNGTTYAFTVHANNVAGSSGEGPFTNAVTPSAANLPTLAISMNGPTSVTSTPVQITYGVTVQNTSNFPITNASMTHTLSTVAATIAAGGAVRDASGNVTITTTSAHFLSIGQSVTIAGVADPTFNGTFTISNVLTPTTFNFTQAGQLASNSGGGSATGLPTANILLAQPGQGICTGGGTGVISVTCSLGNLDPGASVTINVIVQMQSQAIINSATATGNDTAGTVLANVNTSKTTSPPQPVQQNLSAPVGITGNAQVPNPNVGQAGNIVWTITNTTQTAAPNVVVTLFTPNGLTINAPNPPSVSVNNNGAGSCAAGTAVVVNGISGTQYVCSVTPTANNPSAALGGSTKNGAKPPQSMIITQNVTATVSKAVYKPTATVTFGPGGTDTLPNTATVTITVR